MVLCLKARESRSLPGLQNASMKLLDTILVLYWTTFRPRERLFVFMELSEAWYCVSRGDAGWSSPVARQAHNLKAAGSNPAPATKNSRKIKDLNVECFACV